MNFIDFPYLTRDNYLITSPATVEYNCVAWSIGDDSRWWEPGMYWPFEAETPLDHGLRALERLFSKEGYHPCDTHQNVLGFEKVALYSAGIFFTHVARQLPNGNWTSKLGKGEDIQHEKPADLAGGIYGEVSVVLKRPVQSGRPRTAI